MQKKNTALATEPVGRLLFRLAVPAVTAQIINVLYNIVDRIYIGRMENVGSLALTGVGVCMPLILLVSATAALISMGGAPRASIHMGEGKNEDAQSILGNSAVLLVLMSVLLTICILLF
ncbi:MAG: MATE family efflux transporter, partial [Oscillospiraceae bacterium]|nr:MATE family efflux transporter [Oscillospiraceae bacterium]